MELFFYIKNLPSIWKFKLFKNKSNLFIKNTIDQSYEILPYLS